MICAGPALTISNTDEAAYPNSILDDAQTRQAFKAFCPETIDEEETPPKLGFWRRQFDPNATSAQKRFDWLFGVIFPVICFAFDPGIFSGEHAVLAQYAPAAYGLSYAAIMGTMLWLLMGQKLAVFNALLAALLGVSAVVSLVIGVVLFPFSFVGMMFIIGFLGYTPLLMSFSLFRNAVRAFRASNAHV